MVIPADEVHARREFRSADRVRHAGPAELEAALAEGRAHLLELFDGAELALGPNGMRITHDPVLNLPLWELGHIGWFEEHWISRNRELAKGAAAEPHAARPNSILASADALYDSSNVPHAHRWQLGLPNPEATRDYLERVRDSTLALLRQSPSSDSALYFFRLVLFHEDMHREAWHFMAQQLGIDLGPSMLELAPRSTHLSGEWQVPAGMRQLGYGGSGFAFDNELQATERVVQALASWAVT
jgi:iron(II)-dependent oxidoreductase